MARRLARNRIFNRVENSHEHQIPFSELTSAKPATDIGKWYEPCICALAALVALLPFLSKAVHLDDTVFISVAKQIRQHPTDPFGFVINWYGHQMPLHEVQQNGPLASYYMALAASVLGWSEVALHTAFLLPAMVAAVGMYYLARRLCAQPVLAALMMVFSPVFLVSGTTLMCDVIMLAFWIWSVVLWIWSTDRHSHLWAIVSAILIGAGIVTKYYAAALVPLLLAYSLLRWSEVRWRVLYLLIPVLIVLAYDAYMVSLYGHSLLRGAGDHALLKAGVKSSLLYRIAVGLTFTGGCLAAILFYAPILCSKRVFFTLSGLCILVGLVLPLILDLNLDYRKAITSPQSLIFIVQFAIFLFGGIGVLLLAGRDTFLRRDAEACLLGLWVVGTFVFCSLLNWSANGRSLLPMAPPVSILIVRVLQLFSAAPTRRVQVLKSVPLGLTAVLALCVAWADTWWANSARSAAQFFDSHKPFFGRRESVYYTGHWGFQYYMDSLGFRALERNQTSLRLKDVIIFPEHNTNVPRQLLAGATEVEHYDWPVHPFLATMRLNMGAGFYSSLLGPLPFTIGQVVPDRYWVLSVTDDVLLRYRIQQLEHEVTQNPTSIESMCKLAMALLATGRVGDAVAQLEAALQADPSNLSVMNDLAWILATLPEHYEQHLPQALLLAQHVNAMSDGQTPEYLDTLAAALAANQRYDEAIVTATNAIKLLEDDPRRELIAQMNARLQLYKQHQPYREKYPSPVPSTSQ